MRTTFSKRAHIIAICMTVLNRSNLNQVSYEYNYPKYYSSWGLSINSDGTKMVIANHSSQKFVLWIYQEQV